MFTAVFVSTLFLQGTVDYETKAKRLDKVLADLSTRTGFTLTAHPPMNREIVVLSIRGKPLPEVMERLATVTDSAAERTPTGWKLIVDPRVREATLRRRKNVSIAQIAQAQRALLLRLEIEKPFSAQHTLEQVTRWEAKYANTGTGREFSDDTDAMRRNAPGNRSLRRVVASLDPAKLAEIPPNGSLTFSNVPRRMQLAISAEAARPAIILASAEQNAWSETYRADGTYERRSFRMGGDPRAMTEPFTPSEARLVVKASRPKEGGLTFQGSFLDREGNRLLNAYVNLDRDQASKPAAPLVPVVEIEEEELPFSPGAIAHTLSLPLLAPAKTPPSISPKMRSVLLNPAQNEPLGYAVSEMLLGMAKARKVDLVANVPDVAIEWLRIFVDAQGKFMSHRSALILPHLWGIETRLDEHWLTMLPPEDQARLDRQNLARLLKDLDAEGCIRLDSFASFVAASERGHDESIFRHFAEAIAPGSVAALGTPASDSVRLYGLLGPNLRRALRRGDSLRVANLPGPARALLDTMMFRQSGYHLISLSPTSPGRNPSAGPLADATEWLPDGISSDARIAMEIEGREALLTETDNREDPPRPMPLSTVALHRLARESDAYRARDPLPERSIARARPGRMDSLTLRWAFTPSIFWDQELTDNAFDLRKSGVEMSALNADWLRRIQALSEEIRATEPPPG